MKLCICPVIKSLVSRHCVRLDLNLYYDYLYMHVYYLLQNKSIVVKLGGVTLNRWISDMFQHSG